jgi:hypothetical protein
MLQNPVVSYDQLENSPSFKKGFSAQKEKEMRIQMCELIQSAVILLELYSCFIQATSSGCNCPSFDTTTTVHGVHLSHASN